MFKRILVPLDGSSLAEAVMPTVSVIAAKLQSTVILLHVVEAGATPSIHGQAHLTDEAQAESYLGRVAGQLQLQGIAAERHVHPAVERRRLPESLAQHAREYNPDLVVMCGHGTHWLRNRLFGSIAQQLVHQDSTPVLVMQAEQCPPACFPYRHILVPLDGEPGHECSLPPAISMASLCDSTIDLLTVIPTVDSLKGTRSASGGLLRTTTEAILEMEQAPMIAYLQARAVMAVDAGVKVTTAIDRGIPLEQIAAYARARSVDLIVLGTHGKTGTQAFWEDSLASRLIGKLKNSFLLVPSHIPEQSISATP
jgi:nucleotide-binding universal stress UspA family protein